MSRRRARGGGPAHSHSHLSVCLSVCLRLSLSVPVLSHERHLDVAELLSLYVHDSEYESEREAHGDGRGDDEVDLRVRVDQRVVRTAALLRAEVDHVDQAEQKGETNGRAKQRVHGNLDVAVKMNEPILVQHEAEKTGDADLTAAAIAAAAESKTCHALRRSV